MRGLLLLGVSAVLLLFACLIWRASSASPINRRFTAFAVSVACWATGVGASHSGYYMDLSTRIAFGSAAFATASFLGFIAAYPAGDEKPSYRLIWAAYVGAGVLTILTLTTDLIVFGPHLASDEIVRKAGPLYWLFALFCATIWTMAFALFVTRWRVARGRARAELQYLAAGMLLPGCGVLITNLFWPLFTGRSTYGWIGPWFGLMFVGIVGHAIVRRRLTALHLVVHRSLTIATAIILSAVPAVLLLAVSWPHLVRQLDTLELGILLIAVGVAVILTPITRDAANRLLDKYVYRTQANYRRTVREASRMLTGVLHLDTLLGFIRTTIARSTAPQGFALYLGEGQDFACASAELPRNEEHFHALPKAPTEVINALQLAREPLLTDEIARETGLQAKRLFGVLNNEGWALVLPVVSDDHLIAMIAVGPKMSGDPFYQHDLDLLMTLANQAAVAVKNAQLYTAVVVANEYLENIAATIQSGVIAVNASLAITILNRAAENLTGIRSNDAKGRNIRLLPNCLAEPLLATVTGGRPLTEPEVQLVAQVSNSDEIATRPVICTTAPIRNPNGSIVGAVIVFSDLTPLKELELERRRAEHLAYFQALASGIAHEIKNPLVAIKTFTQLLPRRREDERFFEEFSRMSNREIDRVQSLLDRLQTLSRPAVGPQVPVDLRAPIKDALELVKAMFEKKHLILAEATGPIPYVLLGNQGELEQLFLNLLLNAHDATPSGGQVSVTLTSTETHVIAAVSDGGPGITSDLLERIFEPFFTTKARGSGLGLAISSGIAQAHGARLRASNSASGGAVFTVEFPQSSFSSSVNA